MNKKNQLLEKLAKLAVEVGVNIQKNQLLVVNSPTHAAVFARMIARAGYKAGAGNVIINWSDDEINKYHYLYASDEYIEEVPEYSIERLRYLVDKNAALISIDSRNPHAYDEVDPSKMVRAQRASGPKVAFFRNHTMSSKTQWSIVAYPNVEWAKSVFKDVEDDIAVEKLLDAIMAASRVNENNDPVADWKDHMDRLAENNQILNNYHFKSLKFKNELGTDLSLDLAIDHLWAGGGEYTNTGIYFAPNIPTEETFTMPFKTGVNGKVVSTKPLNYQGTLIEDFYLIFKDGKVVDYNAKKGLESLKSLIELDEGSCYLGEVALISHDSPISNMNILFNDTLFDENASCHLALGNAYSMNIIGGTEMSEEELIKRGYNKSMTHVDFMFGSKDMEIDGITEDGQVVAIFRKGNFVFK